MSQRQNNNQNQGGLASRFNRGNNNNQQNNQNNNQNNPFSRGSSSSRGSASNSGSSRFGNRQNNNQNNNQNNRPNPTSRFGNLPSRFGSSEMGWYIEPLEGTFVRFDLDGLGDPFHKILGEKLNLDYSNIDSLAESFEQGGDVVDRLVEQMSSSWESYDLNGAVIIYPWRDEIKQVIAANPIEDTQDDDDGDDDNNNNNQNNNTVLPLTASQCLRSIDLLLVLNVLARTRADLLLADAPLAMESGFLNRSLVTNDPRLVALARATGCVEEHFSR